MASGTIRRTGIVQYVWYNNSPEDSFPATSVTLDLTPYDYVIISFKTQGIDYVETKLVAVGSSCTAQQFRRTESSGQVLLLGYRTASVSSTGVDFSAGKIKSTQTENAASTSNTDMIPISISGIMPGILTQ